MILCLCNDIVCFLRFLRVLQIQGALMSDEAKAAVPGVARSGLVTASGIALGALGSLCIVGILYAAARPLWSDVAPSSFALFLFALPGLAILLAGFATVQRWRGWRAWAGTVSWLMIVFTAAGTMTFLMEPIPVSSFSERLVPVFIALAPGAVGFFALLAKQEEPTADQGAAAALTAAGIIFILLAVLLLICGIGWAVSVTMDPTAAPDATVLIFSAVLLAMALLYGCGGLAMLRRWKRGQTFAKILAWLMIVLLLPVGLVAIITGGPRVPFPGDPIGTRLAFLIFLAMLMGPFVFVLWALRRQKSAAR